MGTFWADRGLVSAEIIKILGQMPIVPSYSSQKQISVFNLSLKNVFLIKASC